MRNDDRLNKENKMKKIKSKMNDRFERYLEVKLVSSNEGLDLEQ